MEDIYWRAFGTTFVMNNEMPAWIVRGFIAESKGININWAKVVESTTKEKASRDEVKGNGQLGVVKRKQIINISDNGGSIIPSGEVKVS
jgi:hypothetical protein